MKNKSNISSVFQEVFLVVLFLTLLSGGVSCWLATQSTLSFHQNRIFEYASATWQTGIGALFGLLGGNATYSSEEDDDGD